MPTQPLPSYIYFLHQMQKQLISLVSTFIARSIFYITTGVQSPAMGEAVPLLTTSACPAGCPVDPEEFGPNHAWWDFRFSRRRVWTWLFSGMLLRRVIWWTWPTFQRCFLLPSSNTMSNSPDDGGIKRLWNTGQFLPDCRAQHSISCIGQVM
jgi:hypothetical protein